MGGNKFKDFETFKQADVYSMGLVFWEIASRFVDILFAPVDGKSDFFEEGGMLSLKRFNSKGQSFFCNITRVTGQSAF